MARRGPSVWFIAAIILYAACAVLGARLLWSNATDPGAADLTAQMQRFEAKARVARVCMIASVAALACMLIDFGLKGRRFYLRRVRARGGQCLNCGYDLRASANGCPECGTPPGKLP